MRHGKETGIYVHGPAKVIRIGKGQRTNVFLSSKIIFCQCLPLSKPTEKVKQTREGRRWAGLGVERGALAVVEEGVIYSIAFSCVFLFLLSLCVCACAHVHMDVFMVLLRRSEDSFVKWD